MQPDTPTLTALTSACAVLSQVQALCTVPWGQLQVIPYYARVAASLTPIFPEVAPGECFPSFRSCVACLCEDCYRQLQDAGKFVNIATVCMESAALSVGIMSKLESDFRGQQRHKDASGRTLESRLRTSRYLGDRHDMQNMTIAYPLLLSCIQKRLKDADTARHEHSGVNRRAGEVPACRIWDGVQRAQGHARRLWREQRGRGCGAARHCGPLLVPAAGDARPHGQHG